MFIPDYSKFFDDSKNLLCVVDKDGVFLSVNKAFKTIFGYNDDDLQGKAFFDFIHPESKEYARKIIRNLTPEKLISEFQVRCLAKDGKYKTILWNLSLDAETGNSYATGADITKIKDNEALLDDALKLAKVGGWELDLTTNEYTWTKEMYDMYGFAVNTPVRFGDLKPYYDQLDFKKNIDSIIAAREQQKSYDIELKLLAADGRKLWVRAIGKPVVEDNKLVKIQGTLQDITKQKESEILLQENEAYIKTITDSSPLGILVIGVDGNCTYTNNAYLEITGLSAETALGRGWFNVIHPDERAIISEKWAEAAKRGENLKITTRYIRADDGRVILINSQAASIFRNGELKGYVATVEDVTEKHAIEEKIRISEQRLRDAQRIANLSYWEFNLETEKLEWSDEAFQELGVGIMQGKPTHEEYLSMIHPDDVDILMSSIENAVKGGQPYEIELRYIAPNGEIHFARTKGVPFYEDGKLIKLTGTSLDITQQKIAELELVAAKEKAEEAMRAKAQFLSTMSHEIRTPLNAVIGLTYLLMHENPNPEQMENLRTLKFSSETLLALINDILDFSKIEAGKITFEQVNFNLLETVNGIKHSLALLAEEKGINLRFRRDEDLPEIVVGDPVRFSQILVNLVSNAIKFTESGHVTIDALVTHQTELNVEIEFSVSDTGIGIDASQINRIFESFTQESGDTTRRFGGTGLGLAITKRLLELQNSSIKVESEKGKGSRFYFKLKFKRPPVEQQKAPVYRPDIQGFPPLANIKILLAEDNKINQFVVAKFLRKWNIEVDIADNGQIAVEKAKSNHYDLVLMDLQMPELDGYNATIAIRNNNGHKIPIIGLTASAADEILANVMDVGMNDCVIKPFNPQELYNKIIKYVPSARYINPG